MRGFPRILSLFSNAFNKCNDIRTKVSTIFGNERIRRVLNYCKIRTFCEGFIFYFREHFNTSNMRHAIWTKKSKIVGEYDQEIPQSQT